MKLYNDKYEKKKHEKVQVFSKNIFNFKINPKKNAKY